MADFLDAAVHVLKMLTILFTIGFMPTTGVIAACRLFKWSPIKMAPTANNHIHPEE